MTVYAEPKTPGLIFRVWASWVALVRAGTRRLSSERSPKLKLNQTDHRILTP